MFSFFEFQMSDRIFISRFFATTVGPESRIHDYSAILDAIRVSKEKLSKEHFRIVIDNFLNFDRHINPLIIKIILKEKLNSKIKIKLKLIKFYLNNPYLLIRKEYLNLLFI